MNQYHPLLLRQLKKAKLIETINDDIELTSELSPAAMLELIEKVNRSYHENDQDRYTIERTLEISSAEMNELYTALREEREKLQSLMSDGYCFLNADWTIRSINAEALTFLACDASTACGQRFTQLFTLSSAEDKQPVKPDDLNIVLLQGGVYRCDHGLMENSQGQVYDIEFAFNPILKDGELDGVIMIFRDVSERLAKETQLRQAVEEAERSSAAKSMFLANMSHEIRTPMNGVYGMLELILSTPLSDYQKEYALTAMQSCDNLLDIINDILDFSKIEAGKVALEHEKFNFIHLVEGIESQFREQARQKVIDLKCYTAPKIHAEYLGDCTRIRQIFVNLVGNALKFTDTGEVTITVNVIQKDNQHDELLISIRDTGIGISEDEQSSIFKKFSQADSSMTKKYQGTGLGLSICKSLVELMNGDIGVHSVLGKGSTFHFKIKLEKSLQNTGLLPHHTLEDNSAEEDMVKQYPGTKVLVVEDNQVNQYLAQTHLETLGCEVTCADNGEEAVMVTKDNVFNIIFMDCQMPVMDGYEACYAIRKREGQANRSIPIVALTANALESNQRRCLDVGMVDFITKPFKRSDLISILDKWIKQPVSESEESRSS